MRSHPLRMCQRAHRRPELPLPGLPALQRGAFRVRGRCTDWRTSSERDAESLRGAWKQRRRHDAQLLRGVWIAFVHAGRSESGIHIDPVPFVG